LTLHRTEETPISAGFGNPCGAEGCSELDSKRWDIALKGGAFFCYTKICGDKPDIARQATVSAISSDEI
jgi:hypothetical protein